MTLARDRFGEKPLHFGQFGNTLLFGSELKALRAHSAWDARLNRDALALMLRHHYIPAPHTIYSGVRKVLPGSYVRVQVRRESFAIEERSYWSARPIARASAQTRRISDAETVERLHGELAEAVNLQMVADVPVGAFLSGGIDSSLIVSLMQQASRRPVPDFLHRLRRAGVQRGSFRPPRRLPSGHRAHGAHDIRSGRACGHSKNRRHL